MRKRIQAWLRGPIIAIGSMALYAIALGCFLALMLLVISMEEGGENLSSSTLDMTRIVVLLSQGIGFETDSLSLSIMPLLLTVLLIGLVWSFSRKICTDIRAYVSGVVVWIFINVMGTQSLPVGLLDWPALVCVKSAVVFSLGFAGAALSKGTLSGQLRELIRHHVSDGVRRTIRTGLMVGVIMMGVYLVMGLITVIVWGVLNRSAMDSLFADIGMGTGSRILTTIASLAGCPTCAYGRSRGCSVPDSTSESLRHSPFGSGRGVRFRLFLFSACFRRQSAMKAYGSPSCCFRWSSDSSPGWHPWR